MPMEMNSYGSFSDSLTTLKWRQK